MTDNVAECRERLYGIVEREAESAIHKAVEPRFLEAVRYVLAKNILCGDALTLKDADGKPITFAEWSMVTDDLVKRRDYRLSELLEGGERQVSLFGEDNEKIDWEYDEETKAYIPSAVVEYAPVNWWEVVNNG